jgi:hypothetical protein
MQALNSLDHLSGVEACSSLGKLVVLAEVVEELATVEEVHDEVQLGIGLEGVVKIHNEGALNLLKNVPLRYARSK